MKECVPKSLAKHRITDQRATARSRAARRAGRRAGALKGGPFFDTNRDYAGALSDRIFDAEKKARVPAPSPESGGAALGLRAADNPPGRAPASVEGPDAFNTKRILNSFLFISFSVDVPFNTKRLLNSFLFITFSADFSLFNVLGGAGGQVLGRRPGERARHFARRARGLRGPLPSSEAGPTKPTPPLRRAAPRAPPAARRLREHQWTLDGLRTFLVFKGCVRYGKG
jgi:hypothetical protein